MRTLISFTTVLLLLGPSAFAEKPYQTVHQRKNVQAEQAHIQAQANEYFNGQFANDNDIVVNPIPDDNEDSSKD